MPIAAVAMPLAAVEVLANHEFELAFVVFALSFGAAVLGGGLTRSHRTLVLGLYSAAAPLLLTGVAHHESVFAHALLMVCGGVCLGSAHAVNRHFVRVNGDAQDLWSWVRPASVADSAGPSH